MKKIFMILVGVIIFLSAVTVSAEILIIDVETDGAFMAEGKVIIIKHETYEEIIVDTFSFLGENEGRYFLDVKDGHYINIIATQSINNNMISISLTKENEIIPYAKAIGFYGIRLDSQINPIFLKKYKKEV